MSEKLKGKLYADKYNVLNIFNTEVSIELSIIEKTKSKINYKMFFVLLFLVYSMIYWTVFFLIIEIRCNFILSQKKKRNFHSEKKDGCKNNFPLYRENIDMNW